MTGIYEIEIKSKRINYKIKLNRNITIIRGNSATGKTELCNLISESAKNNIIKIKSEVPVYTTDMIGDMFLEENISKIKKSIIVIDENSRLINKDILPNIIKGSDNYFILITRNKLAYLPYSYKEVYKFDYDKKTNTNYSIRLYEDYENLDEKVSIYDDELIICEDSKSGYELYSEIFNNVETSNGKSNIVNKLNTNIKLIIADGAAFGSEIEDILNYKNRSTKLYLPESTEYILLNSKIYKESYNRHIEEIMCKLSDNIDSKYYFSWENYFEDKLIDLCYKNFNIKYDKSKLNPIFKNNIDKIYKYISKSIKKVNLISWD